MDFSWSSELQSKYKRTADFAAAHLNKDSYERDLNSTFSTDLWKQCAEFGILGWGTPKSHGGSGHDALTCAYLLEALGYGCDDNGLLFALGTQMWGVQSCLLQFGSEEQHKRYLPSMLSGAQIGAYAINEPDSGSDAYAIQTTAIEDRDSYVLNGTKSLISMSTHADYAIIFAVTDADAGRWGLSAFIVDTAIDGFRRCKHDNMMGLRTVPFGSFELKDCRVPKTALLGKLGAGATIFSHSQAWERSLMLAPQVGTLKKQLETCCTHVKLRRVGQQSISKHQAVSHRVADMRIRQETCQMLLYKTAWMLTIGKQNLMEAAITKTHISEAFVESSRDAISLFGGTGYLSQNEIERNLRDAIGGTIYGGTVDMQRNIIAGLLGL